MLEGKGMELNILAGVLSMEIKLKAKQYAKPQS
jgi:hypothetical protein